MKFRSDLALLLVIVTLAASSCEYQPDSNNYIALHKPDSTYTIVVEITPEEFPEVLEEPVTIKYRFYPTGLSLLGARILIDDYAWLESTHLQDSITIYPYDITPGNRKLSVEFITDSKSGSLADITGYENLVFRRYWDFFKPDICYSGICMKSVFNDNGMLKLEWDTTLLPGFRKYRIYKMCEIFDSPRVIAEIDDFYLTEYHDWEYFGGWAEYRVEVETDQVTAISSAVPVYFTDFGLHVLWVRGSDAMMYWDKSPFDKVVLGYELSFTSSDTTDAVIYTTDNPGDTTYLLNGLAANEIVRYTLRTKIRTPEPGQFMWSDLTRRNQLTYKPRYFNYNR